MVKMLMELVYWRQSKFNFKNRPEKVILGFNDFQSCFFSSFHEFFGCQSDFLKPFYFSNIIRMPYGNQFMENKIWQKMYVRNFSPEFFYDMLMPAKRCLIWRESDIEITGLFHDFF